MKKITDKPSAKSIYIWNIAGSMFNSLLSVLLLLFVARWLNENESDIFSIAWAFGMQALTVGVFQVRLYQATDVKEKYSFSQYRRLRYISIAAMLVYTIIYIIYMKYSFYKAIIVLLICIARALEALSDVYQGWYQQKERLDLAGKIQTTRVIFGIIIFSLSLYIWQNLLISCSLYVVGHIIIFFLSDLRYYSAIKKIYDINRLGSKSKISKLIITCLPLFINAFIIMNIFNCPKFSIDNAIENGILPMGSQTRYGIIFMPASVLNLAFIVFRPMITQMAIEWNANNRSGFYKSIRNIFLYLSALAVVALLSGWFLGCPVLSFIYKTDLAEYRLSLLILILGGVFNTFMYLLDNAITVIRKHSFLVIAYIITLLYTNIISDALVNKYGVLGASITFASSMILLFICTLVIFMIFQGSLTKRSDQNA